MTQTTTQNTQVQLDEALIDAARDGDLNAVKKAIEQKANIHAQDDWAVRWAAANGHLDIVRYLVEEHNADIHVNNDEALRLVALNGHLEMVRYLVKQRANYKAITDMHFTFDQAWPEDKLKALFSIDFILDQPAAATHFWHILPDKHKTDNLRQQFQANSFLALQMSRNTKPRRLSQPQQREVGTTPS